MEGNNSFDAAASAYETVRATISTLEGEYGRVCCQLAETQAELDAAPLLYVPLEDLKAGVLDFVDACGERYANEAVKAAASRFTRNMTGSTSSDPALAGKPLRYRDLDSAIHGGARDYGTQLVTPSKNMFDDRALYFIVAPLVKERLAALMEDMSPEEFGYRGIPADQIGSDRVTRHTEIDALSNKLEELKVRRSDLGEKLAALGVPEADLHRLNNAYSRASK